MSSSGVEKPSTSAQSEDSRERAFSNTSLKRLACDACRARKVRCDRQDPTCGRCAKFGNTCRYLSRAKSTRSKMDLSDFLMTLNSRLQQAEAKLTLTPSITPPLTMESQSSRAPSWDNMDLGLRPASATLTPPTDLLDGVLLPYSDASMFQFDSFAPAIMPSGSTPDENQGFIFDTMFQDIACLPRSQTASTESISADYLLELYDQFFDIFYPIMPIINQNRFQAEMSQPSPTLDVQALSYAIAALGAFTQPRLSEYVEKCYHEARLLLDICERQENGALLTSINTIQAYALLALYEFKQPNFARAWITLGRVTRLAKLIGLDQPEGHSSISKQLSGLGLHTQLPLPSTPADQEERRRTFWLLYIFDAFASHRVGSGAAFDAVISVPIPGPAEFLDLASSSETMPTLAEVFEQPESINLSAFAGLSIMISLYQRSCRHMEPMSDDPTYPFWENHYRIDKAICFAQTTLLTQHIQGHSLNNPMSLTLRMNLDAVTIMLHELAYFRAQRDELPPGVAAEAMSKYRNAAMDIVEAIQLGQALTGRNFERFQQLDRFLVWPITAAIQVCFRMLYEGEDDGTPYICPLRILSNSMKDLIDPEYVGPGLLEKAHARIVEAERSTKKRRVLED